MIYSKMFDHFYLKKLPNQVKFYAHLHHLKADNFPTSNLGLLRNILFLLRYISSNVVFERYKHGNTFENRLWVTL